MVEYCAVLILDNEQIVTDYYYRDYKSSLKRRIMGLEGTHDYMPITTLKHIVNNSNRIYLYNGAKEVDAYKIGLQKLIDIGTDLDKIIIMESNIRAKFTGKKVKDDYKRLIKMVLDGSEFIIPDHKILQLDVLKYILAGFSKVYSSIDREVHKKIKEDAIKSYNDKYNSLLEKYSDYTAERLRRNYNVPLKSYLHKLINRYKYEDKDIEIIKETIKDRSELVNWERAAEGLEKTLLFNTNGSLIHGYMTKYTDDNYTKELRRNYNFIRLEGWGHQYEIQTGRKSGVSEEGKTDIQIYREYMEMYKQMKNNDTRFRSNIQYKQTEDGKDLYTVNLLDLVKACYNNDIFIYEANIHYIELIFRKDRDIEEVKEIVNNILNKTVFKDKLTIQIKEEQ